jgi:hypothetical protein
MRSLRWGAVLLGVTSGLLAMAMLSLAGTIVVNVLGGSDTILFVVIALAAFSAEFICGYVAGRFAGAATGFHGSFAGLGFYAISALLLIIDGSPAGPFTLVFFAVVAAVVGGAGGVLAGRGG